MGKMRINSMRNKDNIIKRIINQISSLNTKRKDFKKNEINEYEEFIKNYLNEDIVQFTKSGNVSKSKKFYKDKNILWLKKTLSILHYINNNETYGTVRKYQSSFTKQMRYLKEYTENFLKNKGYDEKFISKILSNKNFYDLCFEEFNKKVKGYGSDQIIEKVALSYFDGTGFTSKELNKIIEKIEYSQNRNTELIQRNEAFEEFLNEQRNGGKIR